jgi:hypothetical protein
MLNTGFATSFGDDTSDRRRAQRRSVKPETLGPFDWQAAAQ